MGSKLNKHESKYFNTAQNMNKALIDLLDKKEYEYLTIKEICKKAGVNRSTFYLHYETIDDLLYECIENIIKSLKAKYLDDYNLEIKLKNSSLDDLKFYTPKYSEPYLSFIKENKKTFMVAIKHQELFKTDYIFGKLYKSFFEPVMSFFNIPDNEKKYIINYYMSGIHAIIIEWLKNDCKDEISFIANLIAKYTYK